jgi:hypothetical protein
MPLLDGLVVSHSDIHGYGIVTTRPFRKGDIVVYGDGLLFRESESFDDEYALVLPGYELNEDGEEGPALYYDLTCQTRWINHSCDPNTEVDTSWNENTGRAVAWWFALRDIPAGEELHYDYAFSAHLAIPCLCAAEQCRGLIVDEDELSLVPEHLRSHIRPHKVSERHGHRHPHLFRHDPHH